MADHSRWLHAQVKAAVALGINPLDAEKAARFVLDHLPYGADPATYIFPAQTLYQDVSSPLAQADARAAWYADVEPSFARLLDAR